MKNILFISSLLFSTILFNTPVNGAISISEKSISFENNIRNNSSNKYSQKQKKKEKRLRRFQQKMEKRLAKLRKKGRFGASLDLSVISLIVLALGGLFILLGLAIPYVGILFIVIGAIIGFVGLVMLLLLNGINVSAGEFSH